MAQFDLIGNTEVTLPRREQMPRCKLTGNLQAPGDKSISHRALIFASLAEGKSKVSGLSPAADCRSTIECLSTLGLKIEPGPNGILEITSPAHLSRPEKILDAGNSGTTIRLLAGRLAGLPFVSELDGDESLRARPMGRVLNPLQQMGAAINYRGKEGFAPFEIGGQGKLAGIEYKSPVASAQVQTAMLLAGLNAEGKTTVETPGIIRDHTERMFKHIGVPLESESRSIVSVRKLTESLPPFEINVAGDISSAAFFLVASACLPGSDVTITGVGINPGRKLLIDVLEEMGAYLEITNKSETAGEPVADIRVKGQDRLKGTTIGGDRIASGIDEIPILALAGALCSGRFLVKDAAELKVKESNRLDAIVTNLSAIGASVEPTQDGFAVTGQKELPGGAFWQSRGDHRLAMTGLIADLICRSTVGVDDLSSIEVSYPGFTADLESLINQ